jgi:hypothetical protein
LHSNLTNANHVIFLAPYMTDRQYTYDAAMTQAIGRARRFGQKKHVHIYQFVTLKTIDIDILESRASEIDEGSNIVDKKILAKTKEHQTPNEMPYPGFTPTTFKLISQGPGEQSEWGSAVASRMATTEN